VLRVVRIGVHTLAERSQGQEDRGDPVAAQAPPETARIRIPYGCRGMCVAPQYVAEELLRNEGFAEVEYVRNKEGIVTTTNALAAGEIDMLMTFVAPLIIRVDGGTPIVMLAGGYVGCFT
jgi:NitT/TauT family transport system substrate-binding protein